MGTILQKMLYLWNTRKEIKTSIISKGVDIPNGTPFRSYANKILSIQTGNNGEFPIEGSGSLCVTFIDYTGRVLKKHYGNAGFNATAPSDPVISGMVFAGWNLPFTNVQYDTIVGALFYTASGKLEIDVIKNAYTGGLIQTLKLYKDDSSLMTVEWGDGNVSTSTVSGAVTFTNTLAAAGNYTVKVSIAAGGVYRLFSGTNGISIMGQTTPTYNSECVGVRFPATGINLTTGLGDSALGYCNSLKFISIYGNFTNVGGSFVNRCFKLSCVVLPASILTINYQAFYGNNSEFMSCSPNLTISLSAVSGSYCLAFVNPFLGLTATSSEVASCTGITKLIYGSPLVTIAASNWSNCRCLESLTLLSPTPPSLANVNAFSSVPYSCIIYVRKNTATLYAVATNWSTIYTQYQFVELNY